MMVAIAKLFRNSLPFFLLVLSVNGAFSQIEFTQMVRSSQEGSKVNIWIDHLRLQQFSDSVVAKVNSDGDPEWATWSDILTNGNNPGMNVN